MIARLLSLFIWLAAWIAPHHDRARWREEWRAELDEIARRRGPRAALRMARGAAPDALSLRRLKVERLTSHGQQAGVRWMRLSSTDLKLAVRMLVRYPGLTLVGVIGMSVGITIAAGAFTIVSKLMDPSLPFAEGDRIVAIGDWDVRTNNQEQRVLHEYAAWRTELHSVEHLGAVRMVSRNLIARDAAPETVSVAEISASAFPLTRVTAALGRTLMPDDERPGAPDVVVIGDDVWHRRFNGDPGVLGREIQLGSTHHTIVGVMPPGFRFPLTHSFWIPLRIGASYEPLTGPAVTVFARLAPGVSLQAAQTEVASIGARLSAASPATHEFLRARLLPYTHVFTDLDDPDEALALRVLETAIVLLLVVVCVNVAILVYARTATRQAEIAVRSALGASRRRIVIQLFVEALVLSGVAALVAIGLLSAGFAQLDAALAQLAVGFPFWLTFGLSGEVIGYVAAFAIFSAAIVGVLPALKATGRRVQAGLQGLSGGGGARMQMGRLWTLLIVMQVALTVAILPAAMYHAWNSLRTRATSVGYASGEFIAGMLSMERPSDIAPTADAERRFRAAFASRQAELQRRLEVDATVAATTFSVTEPGAELAGIIEIEGMAVPGDPINYNIVEGEHHGYLVRFNRVATNYFDVFGVPILTGRSLTSADAGLDGIGVLVDRTFAERLLGGQNALGRRFRYVGRSREAGEGNMTLGRWYEIAGVVSDFPPHRAGAEMQEPRVYHAALPGQAYPVSVAVRIHGDRPGGFADRFRAISAAVDPALQLRGVSTVEESRRREEGMLRLIGTVVIATMGSVVALSAAGIYALMSFTVSRRRKEIGIRAALGADPRRILAGIFSRVFAQLATGAVLGAVGAIALEAALEGEMFQGHGAVILPMVAILMTAIGLLAAAGPARRGLRIQPTEALREE